MRVTGARRCFLLQEPHRVRIVEPLVSVGRDRRDAAVVETHNECHQVDDELFPASNPHALALVVLAVIDKLDLVP